MVYWGEGYLLCDVCVLHLYADDEGAMWEEGGMRWHGGSVLI